MGLRDLPSVDDLAARLTDVPLPRRLVVEAARHAVDEARRSMAGGSEADPEQLAREELRSLDLLRPRAMVNATGVLLHTNLGRAPVAPSAANAATSAALGYGNLEFRLSDGSRGGRGRYVARLLTTLTGAEDALVVNNNAGALLLTLATHAAGREVVVSRGELIEIGGSFRLPELMAASGARLVEVGTTNRTRVSDYQQAFRTETALALKIHPSNYRIAGFAEDVDGPRLAAEAHRAGLASVYDIGSGLLDEAAPWLSGPPPGWLAGEPGAKQMVAAGFDLVLFSGDKLLGGPQAGIAVGRRSAVEAMARHPFARALRIDGPSLAGLAATLEAYADGRGADLPFWRMTTIPYEELELRVKRLSADAGVGDVRRSTSVVGAGSVPGAEVPSPVLVVDGAEGAWRRLLAADPPILARREAGALILDLRAVPADQDERVSAELAAACRS